jgi:hypothetical protein
VTFYLIPIFVLGALLLLFGSLVFLGRFRKGRYLRPLITTLMKVPFLRRWFQKASTAALERQNPELASAVKKMERAGVARDPQRAAQALSRLNAKERAAYLDATTEQSDAIAQNRQMRRQLERAKKGRRR